MSCCERHMQASSAGLHFESLKHWKQGPSLNLRQSNWRHQTAVTTKNTSVFCMRFIWGFCLLFWNFFLKCLAHSPLCIYNADRAVLCNFRVWYVIRKAAPILAQQQCFSIPTRSSFRIIFSKPVAVSTGVDLTDLWPLFTGTVFIRAKVSALWLASRM